MTNRRPVPVGGTGFFRWWQHNGADDPRDFSEIEFGYPGGPLNTYLRIIARATDAKWEFGEAVFYSVVGAAIGRKAKIESMEGFLFPNLFTFLVGPSSDARKTTSIKIGIALAAGLPVNMYPQKTTPEALYDCLASNAVGLMVQPEASSLFALMKRSFGGGLMEILCELYDAPDHMSKRTKGEGQIEVNNAAFSLLGGTTENLILAKLGALDAQGGMAPRSTFIAWTPPKKMREEPGVIDRLEIARLAGEINARIAVLPMGGLCLDVNKAARAEFRAWSRIMRDFLQVSAAPFGGSLHARQTVVALKVAIIHAVVNGEPCVTPHAMHAGMHFVTRNLQDSTLVVRLMKTDTSAEALNLRVQETIQKAGTIQRSKLLQSLYPHVLAGKLNGIMRTLIDMGDVEVTEISGSDLSEGGRPDGKGRSKTMYTWKGGGHDCSVI